MPIPIQQINTMQSPEDINDLNNIDNFAINTQIQSQTSEPQALEQSIQEEYSLSQIAKSAWERENEMGSFIARLDSGFMFDNEVDDPNFDIADFIEAEVNNTKYAPYAENFVEFKNRRNAQLYKMHLDREFRNAEILENSGWKGIAFGIGVSALSPINAIPIGGSAYKAFKSGKIAKGVAITGLAGGVSVAGTEALLQLSQETRTIDESIINIGAGTILAGTLGGASALLSKRKFNKIAKKVEQDIQTETSDIILNPQTQNLEIKAGSKTELSKVELDQVKKYYDEVYTPEKLAKNEEPLQFRDFAKQNQSLVSTITQDVSKVLKTDKLLKKIDLINNLNPINRLTKTEFGLKPRSFAEKLMKTGLTWNKNAEGIASYQSAEISKKRLQADYFHQYKPLENKAYKKFKERVKKEGFANETESLIKNDVDFYDQLSRAFDQNDTSPIKEIDEIAKVARTTTFSKLGKEAQNVGILNPEINVNTVEGQQSYMPRLYNRKKIVAREPALRELLKNGLEKKVIPAIKQAEASKELKLNSQILDARTQQARLQDALDKANEEIIVKEKPKKIVLPKEIESDALIPNEYRAEFLKIINSSKEANYSLDEFNDLINENFDRGVFPESLEIAQDDLEKIWNKYISGNDLIYTTRELTDFYENLKNSYKTIKENKPKSLLQFIKERGGIIDQTGELRTMGITHKTLPGLLRKNLAFETTQLFTKNKQSASSFYPDYVREAVEEAGYFAEHLVERNQTSTLADLYDLINKEIRGEKVYSQFDMDKIVLNQNAQKTIDDIEALGLNFNEIKTILKEKKGKTKIEIVDGQESKIDQRKLSKLNKILAREQIRMLDAKAQRLTRKYEENQSKYKEIFGDPQKEQDYIDNVVSEIVAKLKGEERLGYVDDKFIKVSSKGPLKERTLNFLTNEELRPFLETDGRKLVNYYQDTLSTDIEIARAFDGDLTLQNALDDIYEEYDNIAKTIKDPEVLKRLDKEKKAVINDIDSVAKIMRGIYKTPSNPDHWLIKGGRIARQFNYITKMGGVVISSFSDLANPIAKHGLRTWAKTLPNLITNIKGIKLNIDDAKISGNITDIIMPERIASFSELNDPFNSKTGFENILDTISKSMSKVNLMPLWNDWQKGWSSVLTQQRMINIIKKYDKADTTDITHLAKIGIGKDNYQIVLDQINKHSYKQKNLWVANLKEWTNEDALRLYQNALNLDVDSTIVSVGAGDLPLWARTEAGKVVLQFRSFTFAATQQILLANLQQKNLASLNGLISATSLGMLSYYLKKKLAGKEPSDDPAVWITEGFDRSGYLAILAEYSHIADKAGVGFASLAGIEQSSRFASRSAGASLLGPSVNLISDAFTTSRALATQDIAPSDAKAIRRMIPFNNHWAISSAFDRLEENLTNTE